MLFPSYPKFLLDKKLYLAGGVAAAFECKTTLKAEHVVAAVKTAAELRKNLPRKTGTPYKELNSTIVYGLLAHSHSWKGENSKPAENIEKALWASDSQFVSHPIECLDFITVADLATWSAMKFIIHFNREHIAMNPQLAMGYVPNARCHTAYPRAEIKAELQKDYFSPLGVLLSVLFSKLAWIFKDMRTLEEYFRLVDLRGASQGNTRIWEVSIFSDQIRDRILNGFLTNEFYNEWNMVYH